MEKFSIIIIKNDDTRQIFTKPNDKLALTCLASDYLRTNNDVKHVIIKTKETKEHYYEW